MMEHVTDKLLALYEIAPHLVPDREGVEKHLATCLECASRRTDELAFDELLADADTWAGVGTANSSETPDAMQQFGALVAEEDRQAVELLAPYETMTPARFVWQDLPSKPEFHTGGVVRWLCDRARAACERDPVYALALADNAIAISSVLPDEIYPRNAVHMLRGEAWKERTNALDMLGRFREAFDSLDAAEAEYRRLPVDGVASMGIVAVAHIRGSLLYEQERFEEAEAFVGEAARTALHFGQTDSYMRARHLQGLIRADQHQYEAAGEVFREILAYGQQTQDKAWIARESLAIGGCELELGKFAEAETLLNRARALYAELGCASEVTRTDWCIARLNFSKGRNDEAARLLRACVAEFTSFEMLTDAALVAVDLAEVLTATGRGRDAAKVASGLVERFTRAGKLTSALTALTYVRDVAAAREAIPRHVVRHVQRFISRAERDPELLFMPPPDAAL